jgi:hypothetical protein
MNHIDLATFRVDCLAIRETELVPFECSPLYSASAEQGLSSDLAITLA